MKNKISALFLILMFIPVLVISGCTEQNIKRVTESTANGEFAYSFPETYKVSEAFTEEWDLAMVDTTNNRNFFLFFYPTEEVNGYDKEYVLDFHVNEMINNTSAEMIKEISEKNLAIKVYKNVQEDVSMASFLSILEVDKGYLFTLQTCPLDDIEKSEPEFLEIVKSVKENADE